MSLDVDVHPAQTEILRVLLFSPDARFSTLQKRTGITSDLFTFHIKKLVELKLVEKNDSGAYALTQNGKEYANRLDTDERTIEKQPKTGVLLVPVREDKGTTQYMVQKRLKQPFYGFYMCLTGKVRWGETIEETAARELKEETNMTAESFELKRISHKRDYEKESGKLLEDKLFYCMRVEGLSGKIFKTFEGGENAWMTEEEIRSLDKSLIIFDITLEWLNSEHISFTEERYEYTKEEY